MKLYIKKLFREGLIRESLLSEADDIKQKLISLIKTGDKNNIELVYSIGEGQGINVNEIVKSMYGDIIIFLARYSNWASTFKQKVNYTDTDEDLTKEDLILLTGLKELTLELHGEREENERFEKFAENNNIDILSNLEYLKLHLMENYSDDILNHWVLAVDAEYGVDFVSKLKNLKELEIESDEYSLGCYSVDRYEEDCEHLYAYVQFEESMVEIREKLPQNIKVSGGDFNFDDMIIDWLY